jgi:hypothetical protein
VSPVSIEIDHTRGRGWFRAADRVTVCIQAPVSDDATVTCVIPGHDRPGREVHTDLLAVEESGLGFRFEAVCGYESTFNYLSTDG